MGPRAGCVSVHVKSLEATLGRSVVAPEARWEHFPHDADIGVRGFGPTVVAAFEQAALALTAVITDPGHIDASPAAWRAGRRQPSCCSSTG